MPHVRANHRNRPARSPQPRVRLVRPAPLAGVASLLAAILGPQAFAQPAPTLPGVRIESTPLDATDFESSRPLGVLRGPALDAARDASLGATLTTLPGVQESGFGRGASRPIIRGFDGPRVGVNRDGLDTLDVSSLSPDHAVGIDPLSARSIEVLRGPATLLYGGSAIGGLVNVVTDTIPMRRLAGVRGEVLASGETGADGRSVAAGLRGGLDGWNWTASAFDRRAGDYRIPGYAVAGDPTSASGRQPNSDTRANGWSAGGSYVGARGGLGLSVSEFATVYGIPSEATTFIQLNQQRVELLGELDAPLPGLERARMRVATQRYRHDEVEGPSGEVGTAFRNRATDTRIEAVHGAIAGWRGAFGLQWRQRRLSAVGEEAYLPATAEQRGGLFWVGERRFGAVTVDVGLRQDFARLTPDAATGLQARSFGSPSAAIGASLPVAAAQRVVVNLGASSRAPVIEELYADGPHLATGTFERGDSSLRSERSINLDAAWRSVQGPWQWSVGPFVNRFSNYVFGRRVDANGDGVADRVDADFGTTGVIRNSPGNPDAGELARTDYAQTRARFVGLEGELRWRPTASPFGVRVFGDVARGRLGSGAGNVPRMSPARLGVAVDAAAGPWSGFVSLLAVQRQDRIADFETRTSGYQRLDAELAYRLAIGGPDASVQFFVQGRNLLDQEIRLATSFVKDAVLQPGRTVIAGIRGRF